MTGNSRQQKEQRKCNNCKNSGHNRVFCNDLPAT